ANTPFDSLSKLRSDLLPTGLQVQKFSGHYVRLDTAIKWFDWHGFFCAISSDKPALGRTDIPILNRQVEIPVSAIVNWIVYIFTQVLGVLIDSNEIYATVENTFTNLKWASENGFADFSSSSEGTNSSWEYRLTFASPHPTRPDVFFSLVTTIVLQADIKNESSWWGLVSSTTARFVCTITALKLSVTKGFKDPV
ncbi:delta-endotoxin CytB, partial [Dendrothele bispora CBS 962.96]